MAKRPQATGLPTEPELLAFIQESARPVGRRDIGRAFHIAAGERRALGDMLDALEEAGRVERERNRRYTVANRVPSVAVLEIVALDQDGDPVVQLAERRFAGLATRIRLVAERRGGSAPAPGDRVLARLEPRGAGHYDARIMRRLEARPSRFFGTFRATAKGGLVEPASRRSRSDFLIPAAETGGAADGELVACETLRERIRGLPAARVTERFGALERPGAASLLAIAENDIPTEFSDAAVSQAEGAKAAAMGKRADLRDIPLVTIDDEDARDFDDAVWAAPDEAPDNKGGWRLRVAIADVACYVRPGEALDLAAYERGNSVYFPDRVVPMLPEALSNGWCSLKPDEDRPCLTVEMRIDASGEKLDHRFQRAMMRSAARLTYNVVQAAHDDTAGDGVPDALSGEIAALYGAYQALRTARVARGTIDLDLPERRIVFTEDGAVARIEKRTRHDSHRLIEEFMILANVCAAETLEARNQPCMYRVHDDPAPDRVFALREYLGTLGLSLAGGQAVRPRHFAQLINRLGDKPGAEAIHQAILRTQSQAVYSPENLGHFGLALRRYAHFTSPIRRYSDLLVHRALISGLGLGKDGLTDGETARFSEIGTHISMTERRAIAGERAASDRLAALFMAEHVGATFAARITGVERFGLFVELDDSGASGLIPRSMLGDGEFRFDERARRLGGRGKDSFGLGDRIRVTLVEANPAAGSLVFRTAGRTRTQKAPFRAGRVKGRKRPARRHRR
ncbi:MAG: ribonuclease R [Alphaproteobacteria bacterium]